MLRPAACLFAVNDDPPRSLGRREFIVRATLAGSAFACGLPLLAAADADPGKDWQWLTGNWDVRHSRLKERLAGSNDWQEFGGKSAFWITMGGLGNLDDNIVELPAGTYRGLSLRTFDPKTRRWAIWWLDGRNPTYIDPPVLGAFAGTEAEFFGRDTFKDQPILVRFRWHEVLGKQPWWDQAYSTDNGASWEINWRNYFTRTATAATPLPSLPDAPRDWDFLIGRWRVKHRRLRQRLSGNSDWDTFGGTCVNWPVLGGHGNADDNVMDLPSGTIRGMGLCARDSGNGDWLSWWIDSRNPSVIGPPLRGRFADGIGTFVGAEELDGRRVLTRVQWSKITANSVRWEQASSADGGRQWETNWISEFTRQA